MDKGEDGEEAPSLLSYTLRYVSLAELGTVCRVELREPMHLCAYMDRGEDGEALKRALKTNFNQGLFVYFQLSNFFSAEFPRAEMRDVNDNSFGVLSYFTRKDLGP